MKKIFTTLLLLGTTLYSQAQIPTTGLVGYYPFNGNANDESINTNNGTVNGALLTADRFGNPNSAYQFDGTSSSITTTFNGILSSNPRSICFWSKSNSSNYMSALGWGSNAQGSRFACKFNYTGIGVSADGGDCNNTFASQSPTNDNNWHFYTFILPNIPSPTLNDVMVYQDGILLTTFVNQYNQSVLINTTSGFPLNIGRIDYGPSNYEWFDGAIDDIRIYDRALDSLEVIEIYNETNSSTMTCFNTPDSVDNTWTGGWSFKEYIVPAGLKIDSVYGDFDRAGYPVDAEDFIFSFCAGTTIYDNNIATSPFNYATINTSLYDQWIDLTAFNYTSIGVVRVYLPINAGATWNDLCFATSPNTTSIDEVNADNTLIYPNPARDFINIKNAKGNYMITDLLGQVVKQIKITSTVQAINIQELQSGVYFLISKEDSSSKKFIVSK